MRNIAKFSVSVPKVVLDLRGHTLHQPLRGNWHTAGGVESSSGGHDAGNNQFFLRTVRQLGHCRVEMNLVATPM